jgi:hypothetical protein
MQRTQYAFKCLPVTAMILSQPSAGAGQFRPRMIGDVGVQPLFQRSRGQSQSLPPRCYLQSFEIQICNGLTT